MSRRTLALVYGPRAACRERLSRGRVSTPSARPRSRPLAQATDHTLRNLVSWQGAPHGIDFLPVELDAAPKALAALKRDHPGLDPDRRNCLLPWRRQLRLGGSTATAPSAPTIPSSRFARTKFRSGAVLAASACPLPPAGLARGLVSSSCRRRPQQKATSSSPTVGSKIGIWPDSRCRTAEDALEQAGAFRFLSRRRDRARLYVPGRNVRASFPLPSTPRPVPKSSASFLSTRASISRPWLIRSRSMATPARRDEGRRRLCGAGTGAGLGRAAEGETPPSRDVAVGPSAGLGLKDVYSIDLRVKA